MKIQTFFTLLISTGIAFAEQSFVFTITADSHLDYNTDRALIRKVSAGAAEEMMKLLLSLKDEASPR